MIPAPITVPARHAVPLVVTPRRGRRLAFAEDAATTPVTIRGVDRGAFEPTSIDYVMFRRECLRHGGRLWQPVSLVSQREIGNAWRAPPAPLEIALAALATSHSLGESPVDGLAGRPFVAVVDSELRTLRTGPVARDVPQETYERGLALGRAAAIAHVESDLLHDGDHLYRALDIPLVYSGTTPSIGTPNRWYTLAAMGVLPHRIKTGRIPHSPATNDWTYLSNVDIMATRLAASVEGIEHGDADIVKFANDVAPGLILMLRNYARANPELNAREDALWEIAAAGSVRAIRGEALPHAVEAIRSAAEAIRPLAGPGHQKTLHGIIRFADIVARPVLDMAYPTPQDDDLSLGQLTP